MKRVISLCDKTGNAVRPWAQAGYECFCVDVQHSIRKERIERIGGGLIHFVWGDARSWLPPEGEIAFVFAFTPCTHVAVSDARDFKTKGPWMLSDSLQLFGSCEVAARYSGAPYCMENPTGVLSSHIRKPDFYFDPCDFAGYLSDPTSEAYTKKTCLWTGNGFRMPEPKRVEPVLGSKMHKLPPSEERQNERSETPKGFALAVFLANDVYF